MSFEIVWGPQAHAALYRIHWRTGALVDGAVLHFAASGAFHVSTARARCRLFVAGHDVMLVVDREERTVRVVGLYDRQR